ncbi:hypothetical protein AM571_CH03752 [Rhizobium etli 8C-3]|uniref:Uncharacterized protein n=2 Tax=Rhizobium TaxID=379 RepID=A0A4R3QCQ1_9HYPH|nr:MULTISPECIES: hypothetical protein [Rhizobium]APO76535.1 hypothetical protein AM571_CH03752 [Rhizobium etli 8C-3]TCU18719.1 hypothetical protein EV130_11457 [Rhizobium azibense]TCU32112.1 hypothetical protein EV129_12261 [Rhizobium azibense]
MEASTFRRRAPGNAYDFLPPEPAARQPRYPGRPADVADAEFVVIGKPSPGFNAKSFNDNRKRAAAKFPAAPTALSKANIFFAIAEEWLQQASQKSFIALVFMLFVLVFGLTGGFSGLAGSDTVASTSPLHFTHVTIAPREANGMRILVINGIIENGSGTTQTVRPIRADLMRGERRVASMVIAPPADVIYGGESRGFSARVQHSGGKMPEVRLSFMP